MNMKKLISILFLLISLAGVGQHHMMHGLAGQVEESEWQYEGTMTIGDGFGGYAFGYSKSLPFGSMSPTPYYNSYEVTELYYDPSGYLSGFANTLLFYAGGSYLGTSVVVEIKGIEYTLLLSVNNVYTLSIGTNPIGTSGTASIKF